MDPSNILFWNVRGLNGAACQDVVRNLVAASKIDVVCLQETKMEDISRITLIRTLSQSFSNFRFLPSVGASSGILVAWRDQVGCCENFRLGNHYVSIKFSKAGGSTWWLISVYGPQGNDAKINFLHELRAVPGLPRSVGYRRGFQFDLQ
jgi:exonuclease III